MEEKWLPGAEPGAEKNLPLATKGASNKVGLPGFDLAKLEGRQTFCRAEKLKSKKMIDRLFKEGKSVAQSGFTLFYVPAALQTFYPVQAGFSVPKRFFKRAVDRNRIKRLMREAYRTNKYSLYQKLIGGEQQFAIMFVYNGSKMPEFEAATKAVSACMNKMVKV